MLNVKILSIGEPERYAVWRLVTAAYQELLAEHPDLKINITEISDASLIGEYSSVIILPTLVINEKVVFTGRYPAKEEVVGWLREPLEVALAGSNRRDRRERREREKVSLRSPRALL